MLGMGQTSQGWAGPAAGEKVGVRVMRWRALVPDAAFAVSCVTLFYCLFIFQGYQKLFRDSDAGWHIRTGEAILETGKLPRTDPYSFPRAGRPWLAWEWGSDVLMGAAHKAGGLGLVAWLYGCAIAAGVWVWFRLHWAVGGNFLLACVLAAPLLSTCSLHWLARPHIFGWILLLAAVSYAEKVAAGKAAARSSPARLAAVAAFAALWTNLHASFFLAPAVAWLYAFSALVRPWIWNMDRETEWRRARWLGAAGVAAAAGTLLNPYGWALHRHVFGYLANGRLLARIGEFQSFDFQAAGAGQILLGLGVAAAGGVAALAGRHVARFLLAAMLLSGALRYARGLPLAALVLLPLANGALTEALARASGLRPAMRAGLDAFLAYSARLRTLDARLSGLAWAPIAALAALALLRTPAIAAHTGFPPDQFPVAAAARVAELPAQARLLAPDKFGGYLIYCFAGQRKVFFDGRSDLYGADFLERYGRMVQLRPGWREQVAKWGFTHALLPHDYPLVEALELWGWQVMYRDGVATLLAAPPGFAGTR